LLNEEKVISAEKDVETLTVKISRLEVDRELSYLSPAGKVGEGVMRGAHLFYGAEASGVQLSLSFDGYEPEWGKLVIGVAKGIDVVPVPSPAVRSADSYGFTLFSNFQDARNSVGSKPLKKTSR
jgi:hypothetical protein